jgi:hypothetical protein
MANKTNPKSLTTNKNDKNKTASKDAKSEAIAVALARTIPPTTERIYSDGLIIQHRDGMFVYSFLQNQWPLAVTAEELKSVEVIEQRCVVQVVVTPEQLAKSVAVLKKTLDKFTADQPEERAERLRKMVAGEITDEDEVLS